MSANTVELENVLLNEFVHDYLDVLDSWQREVDNIRRMHHEVWKGSRLSDLIWQHRAGSRVEKQTRILPKGGQTDVDYMFEVIGIDVESVENNKTLYFKSLTSLTENMNMSRTFGQIFATDHYKTAIENDKKYGNIFRQSFQFDATEQAHILLPSAFKTKVVSLSGLDYETDGKATDNCPSIAGFGAMNEYDGVPCIRLANWPNVTNGWVKRSNRYPFGLKWRSQIALDVPLFVVPTGNPISESRSTEFRLSFSMVEIACFERLTNQMRKLYGISKYVFKEIFSKFELLSSYHIKTLMLWMIETKENGFWDTVKPVEFMCEMISDLHSCVVRRELPHFFVDKCNIYPAHKHTPEKVDKYEMIAKHSTWYLRTVMHKLALDDLGISLKEDTDSKSSKMHTREQLPHTCDGTKFDHKHSEVDHSPNTVGKIESDRSKIHEWTLEAKTKLNNLKSKGPEAYIAGYLTRLLSVITFSIQENFEHSETNGIESIKEITKLFLKYSDDSHIRRLIPLVNSCIKRLSNDQFMKMTPSKEIVTSEKDTKSITAHEVLEKLISSENYGIIPNEIKEGNSSVQEIGVSITKFHQKLLPLDRVIQTMICIIESENNGRCPRFYFHPDLLLQHLQIQKCMKTTESNASEIHNLLILLCKTVGNLSVKVPYVGKLSYRYTGVYLLKAYLQELTDLDIGINTDILKHSSDEKFEQRNIATNFDLR